MKTKKSNQGYVNQGEQLKVSAADYLPRNANPGLNQLKIAAKECQGCSLYFSATQTVFGQGSAHAKLLFVGEQPGDKEDLQGEPFVGPAGQVLDEALEKAKIDRKQIYVTNAVKHFKFEERGKRRLHKKPKTAEIKACRPWLEAEIRKIRPVVVICLGVTAAHSIFNKTFSINEFRGQIFQSELADKVLITVHPSSILRIKDRNERHKAFELFVKDLKQLHSIR